MINIGNLKNAANDVICTECATEKIESEHKRYVELFPSPLSKKKGMNSKAKKDMLTSSLHCFKK